MIATWAFYDALRLTLMRGYVIIRSAKRRSGPKYVGASPLAHSSSWYAFRATQAVPLLDRFTPIATGERHGQS